MPKKVTKKVNISVDSKKQGYWVNKENLRKGERTIKSKKDKILVKRNRSGYEYSKSITGFEWTQKELQDKFAQRLKSHPRSAKLDLSKRSKTVYDSPVLTAKGFFDFSSRDVEKIDTPNAKPEYNISTSKRIKSLTEVKTILENIPQSEEISTLEEIDIAKNLLKNLRQQMNDFSKKPFKDSTKEQRTQYMLLTDEHEKLRKEIDKAEGIPETSKERAKVLRDYLKEEFKKRYGKPAKFSVVKGTGTVASWTQISGSKDEYGNFTKEEEEFLEDVLKGENVKGSNYLPMPAEKVEEHIRRITRKKLKEQEQKDSTPKDETHKIKINNEEVTVKTIVNPYLELKNKYEPLIAKAKTQAEKSRLYDQWEDEKWKLDKKATKEQIEKQQQGKSTEIIKATPDDIDKNLAARAHSFTSWESDKRGESERRFYARHVNEFIEDMLKDVPEERHAELKLALKDYKKRYKDKFEEQLHRHSSLASSAVTGRSNFPVASQKKKWDVYERKEKEFYDWDVKVKNGIRRRFGLTSSGIRSDDPKALEKLDEKILQLKADHELMKSANKIIRNTNTTENIKKMQLSKLGFDDEVISTIMNPDYAGRQGYAHFQLSNNLANIKRYEQRRKYLEEQRSQKTDVQDFGKGIRIEDNVEENRIKIFFDEIPSETLRKDMKYKGFRYAPSTKAWQRYRSDQASYLAEEIVKEYLESKEKTNA